MGRVENPEELNDSDYASIEYKVAASTLERIPECNAERDRLSSNMEETNDGLQLNCTEYKEQNGVIFGCVPLSPIILYTGDPTYSEMIPDIITAHNLIRQSGVPNFLGLRILVATQLNVKAYII